jgi:MtN3 and saliva related transmembrane protein
MAGGMNMGIGIAAAVCSMVSFAPQVIKIHREKDASSVSLRMYLVTVLGFALWTTYGALLKSWPLLASNSVCLLLSGAVLALKLRYRNRPQQGAGSSTA